MFAKWGKLKVGGIMAVLALVGWFAFQPAEAQKFKGKTRPAATKALMKGIVQPNCAGIGGMIKGDGPKDDKAWAQVALNAVLLNEMSYVLMDDGRCPDKDWAAATKTLRECSAKLGETAKAKDVAGTQAAFKGLLGSCSACHTAHKKKS